MKLKPSALALLGLLSASGCGDGGSAEPTPSLSNQARLYLNQLMRYMEDYSINRLTIDWGRFRTSVLEVAGAAQTIPETYPAIRLALELLGDGHSSFRTPTGTVLSAPRRTCNPSPGNRPTLPLTIGYVKVAGFTGVDAAATAFATDLQREIMLADRDDLSGWIVDVRGNGGGNMWPMVAGVGPILGEGVIGYFVDPTGEEQVWEYRSGAASLDGFVLVQVDSPYRLRRDQPRVAVLTDNSIASSGEAVVIAFRGRTNTRSFGESTCGISTAVALFPMTDGAMLGLTTAVMADRSRNPYGGAVLPDEVVADPAQAVQRAVAWIQAGELNGGPHR